LSLFVAMKMSGDVAVASGCVPTCEFGIAIRSLRRRPPGSR
jgi:hypothetical protein